MKKSTAHLLIAVSLITLALTVRLLPHPANFAPVAAVAIFGGAILPRRLAVAVPLAAMVISDMFIGLHDLVLLTWGSYVLFALVSSHWLRPKLTVLRGAGLALGSSITFFVVTNFGVWLTSGMYAHTWSGLARCFYLALPFFRNTVLSDLIYTGLLFGAYTLAIRLSKKSLSTKMLNKSSI